MRLYTAISKVYSWRFQVKRALSLTIQKWKVQQTHILARTFFLSTSYNHISILKINKCNSGSACFLLLFLSTAFTWFLGTWILPKKRYWQKRVYGKYKCTSNHRDNNTTLLQKCICIITVLLFSDHVPSHSQFFFRHSTNVYTHKSPSSSTISYTQF